MVANPRGIKRKRPTEDKFDKTELDSGLVLGEDDAERAYESTPKRRRQKSGKDPKYPVDQPDTAPVVPLFRAQADQRRRQNQCPRKRLSLGPQFKSTGTQPTEHRKGRRRRPQPSEDLSGNGGNEKTSSGASRQAGLTSPEMEVAFTAARKAALYSNETSESIKGWCRTQTYCPGKPMLRPKPTLAATGTLPPPKPVVPVVPVVSHVAKTSTVGRGTKLHRRPEAHEAEVVARLNALVPQALNALVRQAEVHKRQRLSWFMDECIEDSIHEAEEALRAEKLERVVVPLRDALYAKSVSPKLHGDGMARLDECYRLVDTFDWSRSIQQQQFHDAMFEVALPHIVGKDEYPGLKAKLLLKHNRKEPPLAAMLLCPRRWGKSICVSMALAVLMFMCRNVKILIFSQNQAASAEFMSMVLGYFMQIPGAEHRVLFSSSRRFTVTNHGATNENLKRARLSRSMNRMIACPASVDGLRGVTADICVLEEAAVIPREVTEVVIAPLLSVNNTVIFALSTSQDSENYYTRWFRRTDQDAMDMFVRVEAKRVCDDCLSLADSELQTKCKHLEHLVPHWLVGGGGAKRVKVLLGDNEAMYAQEVLNILPGVENTIFGAKDVSRLLTQPRYVVPDEQGPFILTMIDLAGGGSSQHAIASLLVTNGDGNKKVILGLDESDDTTDVDKFAPQLSRYMCYFAQHPVLRFRRHFVCIECNYGGPTFTGTIFKYCQAGLPTVQEYRPDPKQSGAWTSQDIKIDGVAMLRRDLHDKRLVLGTNLASFHREFKMDGYPLTYDQRMISQISKQFQAFRSRSSKNGKLSYDGKTNERVRDDMLIVLILLEKHHANMSEQRSRMHSLQQF